MSLAAALSDITQDRCRRIMSLACVGPCLNKISGGFELQQKFWSPKFSLGLQPARTLRQCLHLIGRLLLVLLRYLTLAKTQSGGLRYLIKLSWRAFDDKTRVYLHESGCGHTKFQRALPCANLNALLLPTKYTLTLKLIQLLLRVAHPIKVQEYAPLEPSVRLHQCQIA